MTSLKVSSQHDVIQDYNKKMIYLETK